MKNFLIKHKHKDNVYLSDNDNTKPYWKPLNYGVSDDTINYIISTCRNYPESFMLLLLSSDEEIKKLSKRVLYKIGNEIDSISFGEILFSNGSLILFKTLCEVKEKEKMKKILIKYHNDKIDKISKIEKGDWIDLRAAETVELKAGEFKIISLGVSMKLPDGYEAHVVPRSSTFKKWGIIQTNSIGIIDNSYSGNNDIWGLPVYALRDTVIHENDRICQFRIVKKMEDVEFEQTDTMPGTDRGGFGSTGDK